MVQLQVESTKYCIIFLQASVGQEQKEQSEKNQMKDQTFLLSILDGTMYFVIAQI